MNRCEEVRRWLEEGPSGPPPEAVALHLATCPRCRQGAEALQALGEAAHTLARAAVPPPVLAALRAMPRFPAPCEAALQQLEDALGGALQAPQRAAFLGHLDGCPACRGTWEALATLRAVGRAVGLPPSLYAALAAPPARHLAARQRRGIFDPRLALAASLLVSAAAALLQGGADGRALGGSGLAAAASAAGAAVEQRLSQCSRRVRRAAGDTWAEAKAVAQEGWQQVRAHWRRQRENPSREPDV